RAVRHSETEGIVARSPSSVASEEKGDQAGEIGLRRNVSASETVLVFERRRFSGPVITNQRPLPIALLAIVCVVSNPVAGREQNRRFLGAEQPSESCTFRFAASDRPHAPSWTAKFQRLVKIGNQIVRGLIRRPVPRVLDREEGEIPIVSFGVLRIHKKPTGPFLSTHLGRNFVGNHRLRVAPVVVRILEPESTDGVLYVEFGLQLERKPCRIADQEQIVRKLLGIGRRALLDIGHLEQLARRGNGAPERTKVLLPRLLAAPFEQRGKRL